MKGSPGDVADYEVLLAHSNDEDASSSQSILAVATGSEDGVLVY